MLARCEAAGAAGGAERGAAADGAGPRAAEAALPQQHQHRAGVPQGQEGECRAVQQYLPLGP